MDDKGTDLKDSVRLAAVMKRLRTQYGDTLPELAEKSKLLLVFLRHAGCAFCRQTLSDLASARQALESRGYRIVLVHLKDAARIEQQIARYNLQDVDRIGDPEQALYNAFGLKRGTLWQLFGLPTILRWIRVALLRSHGFSYPEADAAQLPGVFLIEECTIAGRFRHRSAGDRPDYERLCALEKKTLTPPGSSL